MRKFIPIVCFILSTLFLPMAYAEQTTITNGTIIELSKAGLSDTAIISLIETKRTTFDLGPESLINLKKAGISNKVIEAMLTRDAALRKPKPESPLLSTTIQPKYYGIYVVEGNNLTELDSEYQGAPKELSGEIRFALYDKNISNLMKHVHLVTMKYVNQSIFYDYSRNVKHPKAKISKIEKWDLVFHTGERSTIIDLAFQPVPNNPELVYLTPKKPLSPGAYALVLGSVSSGIGFFDLEKRTVLYKFFIGKETVLSALGTGKYCVDIVIGSKTNYWESFNPKRRAVPCSSSAHQYRPGKSGSPTYSLSAAKKFYNKGKFRKSIDILENIRTKGKDNEDINSLLAKAYINHAYYESRKGRIDAEGKMDLYKKAHEANPNQPEASYNLACLYARKGQKEEAIKWLKISYPILTQPQHSNLLENIKRDPDLNILREYPGFDEKFPELTGGGYGDDQPSTDY